MKTTAAISLALLASCAHPRIESASVPLIETTTSTNSVLRPVTTRASRTRARTNDTNCAYDGNWRNLVSCLWGPAAPQAFRVVACESGGRVNAIGPVTRYGRAAGLFQVMGGSLDPETNVRQAFAKYRASGWRPWVCRP